MLFLNLNACGLHFFQRFGAYLEQESLSLTSSFYVV